MSVPRAWIEAEVRACAEGAPWRVAEYWYSPGWAGGTHGASRRLAPEFRIKFVRRKLAAQADRRERAWFTVAEELDCAAAGRSEALLAVGMYGYTRAYERKLERRVKSLWRLYDAIGGDEY